MKVWLKELALLAICWIGPVLLIVCFILSSTRVQPKQWRDLNLPSSWRETLEKDGVEVTYTELPNGGYILSNEFQSFSYKPGTNKTK